MIRTEPLTRNEIAADDVGGALGRPSVSLALLVDEVKPLSIKGEIGPRMVSQVAYDSRSVIPGALFCAMVGEHLDGHRFAPDALERGAVALVVEHEIAQIDPTVPQIVLGPGRVRPAMATLAGAFYAHPSRKLTMIGVTGTNAKTTITHLIATVLRSMGRDCEVIGTLSATRTTPEAPDLQARFREVLDRHATDARPAVSMEVSSHALVLHRVDGIHFDVAIFTNLSHEHLDFHRTMNDYFEAKALLFRPEHAARAVINVADPWGRRLFDEVRIPTVGVDVGAIEGIELGASSSRFLWRGRRIDLPLTGEVNVANAVLAAEALSMIEVDDERIVEGLARVKRVPGRLEPVAAHCLALVDYAHTPVALGVVLEEARRLASGRGGRVIVVFGCGGNRDAKKRPLMGEVASRLADTVIITSDSPRTEDPATIAAAIAAGASPDALVELDRCRAIELALDAACDVDVVVIAGKGSETVQEIAGVRHPFNDAQVIEAFHVRAKGS